ncbi:catalase family peroxidase [Asaia krungthepensis]|uniref:Catalase-related peroxidase n=1 Tax=Asaia krungthepensis NRIC 0535 TaxID=1307925 RepID=A0ABQ0Q1D2_9PROT|nr:catalase family peroxidase [Asaia krungthepensis]GBQ86758.1 catalase [Asaia krungthepensis NRIC 0535]
MPQKLPHSSGRVLRWLGVASLPCLLAAGFAVSGGWLSPHRVTQNTLIAALQGVDGKHPGFRRNHAKGVCVTGWFEGNGTASALSTSSFLEARRVPVIGRFALAGGMPYQGDAPGKVRSLGLSLRGADGQEWRMGINDIPVFPVRTPEEFQALQLAVRPNPATGKPDPAQVQAFRAAHPWLASAGAALAKRPITSGFENDTYRSLDSFLLQDAKGHVTAVRYAMVPEETDVTIPALSGENALFERLANAIAAHPLRWTLVFTVAGPGDVIDDPSREWSGQDRQIEGGILTIDRIESEETGSCTGITYDPLILPPGVSASGDPVLQARSAAYMRSFAERSREPRPVPAVTPATLETKSQDKAS